MHTFPTYQCLQKSLWDFFKFCLELELFATIKNLVLHTHRNQVYNNSRSKQNKKNSTHPFVDITNEKTCARFQQKILNSVVVQARQSFQFFRQKTWSLGNNRGPT